jgi:hypothetical protein
MLNEEDYKDLEEITNSMLESFKYYLEGVKTSMLNVRDRSFFEKLISCPIDTTTMGKLPVFFKDPWYEFANVLLSGHEFMFLFYFINFVNIFYIATNNIYYSFFITFIFEKLTMMVCGFFIKRNISRNTLIDDKFFS